MHQYRYTFTQLGQKSEISAYGACHLPRSITVCTGPAIYPGPSQHVYGACHLPRSITACTCFPR